MTPSALMAMASLLEVTQFRRNWGVFPTNCVSPIYIDILADKYKDIMKVA
jgi:hypothetical protein